jgi:hypothetical protein
MGVLDNVTQTSGTSTTSLPSWYDAAQQQLVSQGQSALAAAPQLGQTVAQNAINTLSGPNNPFSQASNTLNTISSGAANPWLVDASGNVTPNVNTAMGGLFQAQNQQLNQLLPTLTAPAQAAGVGTGNFGSLRGQTAVDTAKANAFANLATQQMQAALQNQQTGSTAAANLGNVGQQGITNAMNVGQAQMTAPFTNAANFGNILGSINAPQTVRTTQTPSGLQQLTGLGSVVQGGLQGLMGSTSVDKNGNIITTPGMLKTGSDLYKALFGGSTGANDLAGGMTTGQTTDALGNIITDPTYGTGSGAGVEDVLSMFG